MKKVIPFLLVATILFSYQQSFCLDYSVTLTGPNYAMCDGPVSGEWNYLQASPGDGAIQGYKFECTNCIFTYQSVTSTIIEGNALYGGFPLSMAFQVDTGAESITMDVTAYRAQNQQNFGTITIPIGAPNTTPGGIHPIALLENCDANATSFVDIYWQNSWEYAGGFSTGPDIALTQAIPYPYPVNGPDVYIKSTNVNATGIRYVSANFTYKDGIGLKCGLKTSTQTVQLTGPLVTQNIGLIVAGPGEQFPDDPMCMNETNILSATYFPATINSWEWIFPSGWNVQPGHNSSQKKVLNPPYGGYVQLRGTNNCGPTGWKTIYVDVIDCGGGVEQLMVAPNPVTEQTTSLVPLPTITAEDVALLQGEKFKVDIYMGTLLVYTKKNVKIDETIDLAGLEPGDYVMHIFDDKGGVAQKHILIE